MCHIGDTASGSSIYHVEDKENIPRPHLLKAIRGGRDSVHFSSVLKLPVSGKKLGVSLAYRQFISEKKQYAAAIIVTAILAMFMILMNDMMRWFNSQNMLVDMVFSHEV